jgi:hypothetical protein
MVLERRERGPELARMRRPAATPRLAEKLAQDHDLARDGDPEDERSHDDDAGGVDDEVCNAPGEKEHDPVAVVAFAFPAMCAVSKRMANGARFSTRF